jgi:hypothetical protein
MIKHTIRSKEGGTKIVELTPLKAIRRFCLECLEWKPSEVKSCTDKRCCLSPYRFGSNPERKGIGNNFIKKG